MKFSWGTRIAVAVCIAGLAAPAGPAEGSVEVDPQRVSDRYLPSSTFKIPNTLLVLAEGVAGGPDHVFPGPRDPFLVDGQAVLPENATATSPCGTPSACPA
jgi:hypothetical protein